MYHPSQHPSARLRMLPSPFARFFAMSIAPFFGSHNTYHTLRRKATDSSKEIDFFENAFIDYSSAKCTRVLNCLLRFLGQRSAIVNHSKMCYLLRRSVHTEFYTFHTKWMVTSSVIFPVSIFALMLLWLNSGGASSSAHRIGRRCRQGHLRHIRLRCRQQSCHG